MTDKLPWHFLERPHKPQAAEKPPLLLAAPPMANPAPGQSAGPQGPADPASEAPKAAPAPKSQPVAPLPAPTTQAAATVPPEGQTPARFCFYLRKACHSCSMLPVPLCKMVIEAPREEVRGRSGHHAGSPSSASKKWACVVDHTVICDGCPELDPAPCEMIPGGEEAWQYLS